MLDVSDCRRATRRHAAPHTAVRLTRRALLGAGVTGAAALTLAACGVGGQSAPNGGTAGDTQPVSLDLWHGWGTTGGGLAMEDLSQEYQRRHPNVTINVTTDATKAKFLAAIAADSAPDVQQMGAPDLIEYAEQNALLPLDDLIKRDKWDMKQYFDFAVQQTSRNGKVLAITHHPDIRLGFWNKKLYREAGLDENKPVATWTDLEAVAQRAIKRDRTPISQLGFQPTWLAGPWLLQYLQANGVKILSDDGKKAVFNTATAVDTANWVLKITDGTNGGNDAVTQIVQAAGNPNPNKLYSKENTALILGGNWFLWDVGQDNPALPFGLQAWRGGPGASGKTFVFGGGTMVAIPRGSKKQPAAWEFLKFVGSKDGGYLVQKRTSDVSGHREAANMPEIVTKNLGRKEVLPYFEKTNALSYVDSPAGPGVTTALASAQTRILKHDGASKDILADALQQAQQALDDYWSRHG